MDNPRPRIWKSDWLFLAALLLLVSLHFWFPNLETGPTHDTYSTTTDGKKAFYLLVRRQIGAEGGTVQRRLEPLATLDPEPVFEGPAPPAICILGPQRYPDSAEWDRLLEWVAAGGHLLIAARYDEPEFGIEQAGIEVERLASELDVDAEEIETGLLSLDEAFWRSSAEITAAPEAFPLIRAGETLQAASLDWGSGLIVVVASDDIFSNEAVAWQDHGNTELAFALLRQAAWGGRVRFDESLNLTGTPKAVGLLLNPFLRPVTVQLLIGLLLFAWSRRRRFGPLRPRAVGERHNIVDHTDALGMLNFTQQSAAEALRSYLRQLFTELKLKSHRGREERVLEPIAVRMQTGVGEVKGLLQRCARATREEMLSRREAAELIRKLALVRRAALQAEEPARQTPA